MIALCGSIPRSFPRKREPSFCGKVWVPASAGTNGDRWLIILLRQALLRWANEEVLTQVRSYLARPWTTGDEATFEQEFLCECGNPECAEIVELTVADYAPGVSAHG